MNASPRRSHSGSTSRSGSRVAGGCTRSARRRTGPRPRAPQPRASRSCSAEKFEQPISRTLPAWTSSSSAPSVSAIGTVGIGLVELVEVDAVGLQPAQAVLDRAPHVLGPGAAPLLVDGHAELGREHHLVAAPGQRAAEKLLAAGAAVDVGGVEEVDAGVERRVDDARGGAPRRADRRSCCSRARPPRPRASRCVAFP